MQKPLAKKLQAFFEVRNTLVSCETLEGIIDTALQISRDRLQSQTASVFLFSKRGVLERVGIKGTDKDGTSFCNDWFTDEKYSPGDSFTGKVVLSREEIGYGTPFWSNNLDIEKIELKSREAYLQKLGFLKCAIAVPLNGQHRTYGVLEIINKIDKTGKANRNLGFSQDDVYWLSNIGINLATSISNLRRKNELGILNEISRTLVEPFGGIVTDLKHIYSKMIERIVDPLTSYKACVLRVGNAAGKLEVMARVGHKISWDLRLDAPINKGEGLVGKVFEAGKREIIEDIATRIGDFKNIDWIKARDLKSYACFPLSVQNKTVGTLSLYVEYVHKYYDSDIKFIENITFQIASFIESLRVINELHAVTQELDTEKNRLLSSARAIGYDLSAQSLLHDHKHILQSLQEQLEFAETSSPNKRIQIIKSQVAEIKRRLNEIMGEMEGTSSRVYQESVDINQVIRHVVRIFNLQLKDIENPILFTPLFSNNIPLILASNVEIRDVIFNLVSNAVKAIQSANRKRGEIVITTEIANLEIPFIQITVEDNGIGIRNEDRHKIYKRGYTTYEDGSGAGLFITHNIIVNNYGGQIDFNSTVGKGTKFIVRLPKNRLQV